MGTRGRGCPRLGRCRYLLVHVSWLSLTASRLFSCFRSWLDFDSRRAQKAGVGRRLPSGGSEFASGGNAQEAFALARARRCQTPLTATNGADGRDASHAGAGALPAPNASTSTYREKGRDGRTTRSAGDQGREDSRSEGGATRPLEALPTWRGRLDLRVQRRSTDIGVQETGEAGSPSP